MSVKQLDHHSFMESVRSRSPGEDEFLQAVAEVAHDLIPIVNERDDYRDEEILLRLTEPDRMISFRVAWIDDQDNVRVNRGYRVQFNSAIGPYKGGLRFHPTVNPSILKFLGFEQTLKNALTGLPMGGGKGGADFDPRGCSDREIMKFCQAFMVELHRHIRCDVDVPAGDINVGSREIGYLFGAYKRITNSFEGVLTGKGLSYGGSALRTEATGYGLLYFVSHMLEQQNKAIDDQVIAISGAGNVATYAAEKAVDMGARVITLSNSQGFVHDKNGLTREKIDWIRENRDSGVLEAFANEFGARWHKGKKPWGTECTVALPCATQNELEESDARSLVKNDCRLVAEGANMPTTADARIVFAEAGIVLGPGKAANAGGVAVSGLEISQNRTRRSRERDDIDNDLHRIMKRIHNACVENSRSDGKTINYARGANVAGFRKVAEAMLAQGVG